MEAVYTQCKFWIIITPFLIIIKMLKSLASSQYITIFKGTVKMQIFKFFIDYVFAVNTNGRTT